VVVLSGVARAPSPIGPIGNLSSQLGPIDAVSALTLIVIPFLVGVGMLVYVWRCWSGRSRRWATRVYGDVMVLLALPTLGVFSIAFAVKMVSDSAGSLLVTLATIIGLLGLIAMGFEAIGVQPRWWGPGWYHDVQASNWKPDLSHRPTAALVSSTVPAPFSSDRNAAQAFEGMPVARWWANYVWDPDEGRRAHGLSPPGGVLGHLTLYPSGLTFAANAREDSLRDRSTVVMRSAAEVIGARVVPARAGADGVLRKGWWQRSPLPRLVVDTRTGSLLFEVVGAKAKAARISDTLGRGSR
jgi:hypothetical protein